MFWTDTRVTDSDTFAFESTVKNQIRGIGQSTVDLAAEYGSGGRLASVVLMDTLTKYPADPEPARQRREHRRCRWWPTRPGTAGGPHCASATAAGANDAWLGRQLAHWSFFTDSDASVLEGNEIQDAGGSFRTTAPSLRYSPFDLYAMGVLRESEVPPTFYVGTPVVTDPDVAAASTARARRARASA